MEPRPFQEECIQAVEGSGGRSLLSADMGLGKSAMSLWYAARNGKVPVVVVCPASVKWQWQAEVMKVLGWRASVCEGMKPNHSIGSKITIINYDILGGWLQKLKESKPKLVVIDECQYIQSGSAKRTKNVIKLCSGVRHVVALSGTPMLNRPIELWPTLHLLRPKVFSSKFSYGLDFCGGRRGRWGWEFNGATKTEELHKLLLETCMVRRRKVDVLTELPDKIRQVVPVDMRDADEYQRAEADFISWLRQQDPAAAVRAKRAEAVVKAGYLLRLAAKLKCRSVYGWVNDWLEETDEKMVIFAVHRKMIEALQRNIKSQSVVIDGSVGGHDRKLAVDQFQTDKKTRVLIGNVQAAGVGLNLTRASSVAFAELPWQPGAVMQAEDRCHRIGQMMSVNIYFLVAHSTVEEKRAAIIGKKQEVLSAVMDGGRVEGDLDVFDEFIQSLK